MRAILDGLDAAAVSSAARRETRNREIALPPTGVYRWWARRTEAVFGAVLDASTGALAADVLDVLDPFAGGGVIPFAAVRRGHRVHARELDPWAATGLAVALDLPDPAKITAAAERLIEGVAELADRAYATTGSDGSPAVLAHTFRVAVADCGGCGRPARLFPHATVSALRRRDRGGDQAWLACRRGHLFVGRHDAESRCPDCDDAVSPGTAWTPGRAVTCPDCSHVERLSDRASSLRWEVVLVERVVGRRRELARPTAAELAQAERGWRPERLLGPIPEGAETRVLLRHGLRRWEQLYPARQRAVTEALLVGVEALDVDEAVRRALGTAVLGTTEMAGLLSRWDRWYLKSFEAMAGHRFNLTTFAVEPNVLGAAAVGRGTLRRRLRLLVRAARWLRDAAPVSAEVTRGSSEELPLPDGSVDLVLTDPPYHDDVHYAELSAPLRAWAGLPVDLSEAEAVAGRGGPDAWRLLLGRIFAQCRRVLRPGGRLVLTFANRNPVAWADLFDALQGAGFAGLAAVAVHSENERDAAKRGVRACTLDLVLELAPAGQVAERPPIEVEGEGDERAMLRRVVTTFARVGRLEPGWREPFEAGLAREPFLS
jgi:putative DNA methylase